MFVPIKVILLGIDTWSVRMSVDLYSLTLQHDHTVYGQGEHLECSLRCKV